MTQHLDGRTDRQHGGAAFSGALQAGILQQMSGGQPLGVVLGAAEGVQIQRVRYWFAQRDFHDLGGNPPQQQALSQHHRIAAVAVGAHHIRKHQPDPDCHARFSTARCNCRNAV